MSEVQVDVCSPFCSKAFRAAARFPAARARLPSALRAAALLSSAAANPWIALCKCRWRQV